jgi:hypothetical protein
MKKKVRIFFLERSEGTNDPDREYKRGARGAGCT